VPRNVLTFGDGI